VGCSLHGLRAAALGHLHAAERVLAVSREQPPAPSLTRVSGCYLAQVALECSLKAQLLFRAGCVDEAELQGKQPRVHEALFRSRRGHDLQLLAHNADLRGLLATEGKAYPQGACWSRLTSAGRPYSLRYGTEDLRDDLAAEEIGLARVIAGVLLGRLGRLGAARGGLHRRQA
jgi:hypothetical protein